MPKGRVDEITVEVQHALTAEFLGSFSLSASSKGDVLRQHVSQHLRHPDQQEIKLHVLNEGPVLLERNLRSQAVVSGTVVTYLLRQKRDNAEVESARKCIAQCLSGSNAAYISLAARLTPDQIEEVCKSLTSAVDCLWGVFEVGSDSLRSYLLCISSRLGKLRTDNEGLGVQDLLAARVEVSSRCKEALSEGGTALHVAISWGRPKVARVLLEARCSVLETDDCGDTPLLKACLAMTQGRNSRSHLPTVGDATGEDMMEVVNRILARCGPALVNKRGWRGETALIRACSENLPQLVNILIQGKAEVNLTDDIGNSALHHLAAKPLCQDLVAELLRAQAIVDLKGEQSYTSLMFAVQKGNVHCVERLLKARASVPEACLQDPGKILRCALANCTQGHGAPQMKIFAKLIEADDDFLEQHREELLELAAEEADTDLYEFLSSSKRCRRT
ncbi:unnamed protein product [Symbiodinium pilosum]|uniref:Uncharacterized protein n=1 Tax=Symbiodinium pilosum TaxID=2952 RepID=A0A812Q1E2_SYMPI|nr:unnamed protein product [Symbiodinium pilosum]